MTTLHISGRAVNSLKGKGQAQGRQRRADILQFMAHHTATYGMPPTIREIGTAVGLASISTVKSHLTVLSRQGAVIYEPHKPRSHRLANFTAAPVTVDGPPPWATTLTGILRDIAHLLAPEEVTPRNAAAVRALAAEGEALLRPHIAKETTP